MRGRFLAIFGTMILSTAVLIATAIQSSGQRVITVNDLVGRIGPMKNVRLGARVAEGAFFYQTVPDFLLRFAVHDIGVTQRTLPVEYRGLMPDTLRAGRDVILEGDFDGQQLVARSLLTQCPSKYEPPAGP